MDSYQLTGFCNGGIDLILFQWRQSFRAMRDFGNKAACDHALSAAVADTQAPASPDQVGHLDSPCQSTALGTVEAASEAEAIAKGTEEFKQPKERLMAVRRT